MNLAEVDAIEAAVAQTGLTVQVARAATQSGLFPVFEAEGGEVTGAAKIRRKIPVEDYLRMQKRYAHLFSPTVREDVIDRLQAQADKNIARYGLLDSDEGEA